MRPPIRLLVFLAATAGAFGIAVAIGGLVGPVGSGAPPAAAESGHSHDDGGHGDPASGHAGGLAVSSAGYTLEVLTAPSAAGTPAELAFRVVGPTTAPVTSYVITHQRPMHLIVVRRDLSGFQHLHPVLGADGVWRTPIALPEAGSYRLIADFAPDGRTDSVTLGTDVSVPGQFAPQPVPAPTAGVEVDGYSVTMTRDAGGVIDFAVLRDGQPVTDLQPYLGARGHLVMLRAGDLAYLHTHPDAARLSFVAEPPSPGDYRLYLEFQHDGAVHTAAFTVEEGP